MCARLGSCTGGTIWPSASQKQKRMIANPKRMQREELCVPVCQFTDVCKSESERGEEGLTKTFTTYPCNICTHICTCDGVWCCIRACDSPRSPIQVSRCPPRGALLLGYLFSPSTPKTALAPVCIEYSMHSTTAYIQPTKQTIDRFQCRVIALMLVFLLAPSTLPCFNIPVSQCSVFSLQCISSRFSRVQFGVPSFSACQVHAGVNEGDGREVLFRPQSLLWWIG